MFSGEKSTLDKMLARGFDGGMLAGVNGGALEEEAWLDGVVGVPGERRGTGLTPGYRERRIRCYELQQANSFSGLGLSANTLLRIEEVILIILNIKTTHI